MKKQLTDQIKSEYVLFDGAIGSMLQTQGLKAGEKPELWNLTHREEMIALHRAYCEAGADVICTNTFGANCLKYKNIGEIVSAAVENAKAGACGKWIALSIGPTGKILQPYGDLSFEAAVEVFGETVRLGAAAGADLIILETFTDCFETKAALVAAKENCNLPVFVTNAYDESGKLASGTTPEAMVAMLEGLGADAIGINCSLGPVQMLPVIEKLIENASVPIIVNPNAGMPRLQNGKTMYDFSAADFKAAFADIINRGVNILGGCCGTTPEYIAVLRELVAGRTFSGVIKKHNTVISSATQAVCFGKNPLIIGERINPTGKPDFKSALRDGNLEYALTEGIRQQECGAHILDVNVGLPEIDETAVLTDLTVKLQAVSDLPLQLDTSNGTALASALRVYNGKPMINSVNGKAESMNTVFPLAKKYGGVIVALTLDENGIPDSAEGRFVIAQKILAQAEKFGIDQKNILFDTLTMAVSADRNAAKVTLDALAMIKNRLGCHTVLGVSNVSFGLPNRAMMNAAFLSQAIYLGLDGAIINPFSADMLKAFYSAQALVGADENFATYVSQAAEFLESAKNGAVVETTTAEGLKGCIIRGLRESAKVETERLLATLSPLDIINNHIIPALNDVGDGFEKKTIFLPGLLIGAEAAKAAFDVLKSRTTSGRKNSGTVVLATVRGDIHDIGKNIVKLLLESHNYAVEDVGKDVAPQLVVDAVKKSGAHLVGLSALMTTTVPAMAETIRLLKSQTNCKVMVGGAVITAETAESIGADFYAKDATESVRIAAMVCNE